MVDTDIGSSAGTMGYSAGYQVPTKLHFGMLRFLYQALDFFSKFQFAIFVAQIRAFANKYSTFVKTHVFFEL